MPSCSVALEESQDERRRRLALLEWQHEGALAAAGRLCEAATEVAPLGAGWALRHRRMHKLQVSSR
jgi:hypothetical protein